MILSKRTYGDQNNSAVGCGEFGTERLDQLLVALKIRRCNILGVKFLPSYATHARSTGQDNKLLQVAN